MTNKKKFFNSFTSQTILCAAWLIIQAFLFYKNGIVTDFESEKYIEQAHNLIAYGNVSSPNFWLYSVQIFLIAGSLKLHAGFVLVVIIQLLFNAVATILFYKLAKKLSDAAAAFVCTLLLILNFPFQTFNSFLFTESLFYSFLIIFTCFLLRLSRLNAANFIKLILFLLVICFTRPTGLLLIPAVSIYLLTRFFQRIPAVWKIIFTMAISFLFIFILNAALGSGGELNFILPLEQGHIICGVPTINATSTTSPENSLSGIMKYIFHHPGQFFHLAWLRSLAFWGLMRSYFSTGHNIFLAVYFFPIYLFAILSIREWYRKNPGLLLYCVLIIVLTWGMVLLSCDDWHNRFFLTLTPFLYLLSLPFLERITTKLFSHEN